MPGGIRMLKTNASEVLIWRTVAAVLGSILPMVVVVGYDMFLLNLLHDLLLRFLPAGVVAYITATVVAVMSFVFAATYAAIPLLLASRSASPRVVH
jgi:hypothetical protein